MPKLKKIIGQKQADYIRSFCIVHRYKEAKRSAARRDISWDIPFDIFEYLVNLPCYYCGQKLEMTGSCLDRFDNTMPYITQNTVPCCWFCNKMKSDMGIEFFIKKINLIYRKFIERRR